MRSEQTTGEMEKVLHLRSNPFFGDLSQPRLATIANYTKERFFRRGELLLREGEPVRSIFIITGGTVRIRRGERHIGVVGPRFGVGALGLLAQSDEEIEAVAETPTRALELSSDDLLELLEDEFSLVHDMIQQLTNAVIDARQSIRNDAGFNEVNSGDGPTFVGEGAVTFQSRSLDLVERMFFLTEVLPFKRADTNALAGMARELEETRIPRGTVLWRSGDPGDDLQLVVAGMIRCETDAAQHFSFGPGSAVGALDATSDRRRWYAAIAETDVVALRLNAQTFIDILEDHQEMAMGYLSMLASTLLGLKEATASITS